jgi:hypothetical protein
MQVLKAIQGVMKDLVAVGISKDQFNTAQKFKFRGIDDVYAAVAPLLVKHELLIVPDVQDVERVVRERENDKITIHTVIKVRYQLFHTDGSTLSTTIYGEAADSGDKGVSKALSMAYKYLVFQSFCVPTEGQGHDPDAEVVEFKSKPKAAHIQDKETAVSFITPAQAGELNRLFIEAKANATKFLEHHGITNLSTLPAREFDPTAKELRARIQAAAQSAEAAAPADEPKQPAAGANAPAGGSSEGGDGGAKPAAVGARVSRFRGTR